MVMPIFELFTAPSVVIVTGISEYWKLKLRGVLMVTRVNAELDVSQVQVWAGIVLKK